ncbi:hypothetical protein RFI_26088 [Reticulomyxa filosa]|uniref:Uncharacterized protein n=1 Tax=Reticulomyxa filosa TaxID=46433 RepID=X6ME19_RETFI|nr:hypothetical protein RFI_26088 [Reticulomyxa filosa]|eukprot:ETO11290.1 hypothetical protein RFI_26088 [Reticulomyxa filosa]
MTQRKNNGTIAMQDFANNLSKHHDNDCCWKEMACEEAYEHLPTEELTLGALLKEHLLKSWKPQNDCQDVIHLRISKFIRDQIIEKMNSFKSHDKSYNNNHCSIITLFSQQQRSIQVLFILICCFILFFVSFIYLDSTVCHGNPNVPTMECKYCNTCVSLGPFELIVKQTLVSSDVHPAAAAKLQDSSPPIDTNSFNANVSDVVFALDNTQATFAINNEMYKHETHLITDQLSQLGLTLKSPMNRQVDLDIYPTSALQSPADFGDITNRTINYQHKTTSLESAEANCQWPRRCYLLNTNWSSEELAEPMQSTTDLDRPSDRFNLSKNKRSLSQFNNTEIQQPINGYVIIQKNKLFFLFVCTYTFRFILLFFVSNERNTYIYVYNDEATTKKNKKMKKISPTSPINPRKRKRTDLITDQKNRDNNNTQQNDNDGKYDNKKAFSYDITEPQRKRQRLESQDANVKSEAKIMFESIPEESIETKENNNVQNNSIAPAQGRKRKREEMGESCDVNNESQQNIKRRRLAHSSVLALPTIDISLNNELNIIQQHKLDCPFVRSHYYLGKFISISSIITNNFRCHHCLS